MECPQIFTPGHSTLSLDAFLSALQANVVSVVADVRSAPYSRFNPAFNRDPLSRELKARGMRYVFLGKELGGRPADPTCYENGRASYSRMAQTDVFREGLDRVIQGSRSHRIALMCSEGEPLNCHRTLLIGCFRHQVLLRRYRHWDDSGSCRPVRVGEHQHVARRRNRSPRGREDVPDGQPPRGESRLHRWSPGLASELQRSMRSDEVVVAAQ